jgi:hypothetical protein
VPEYWLVDPESRQIVKHRLEKKVYVEAGRFHDSIAVDGIAGITVDLSRVW